MAVAAVLDYPSLNSSVEGKLALAEIDRWRLKDEADEKLWEVETDTD